MQDQVAEKPDGKAKAEQQAYSVDHGWSSILQSGKGAKRFTSESSE